MTVLSTSAMIRTVPIGPYELTASEHAAVLAADRGGTPYVLLRDGDGRLMLFALRDDVVTIGRAPESDLVVGWDGEASRAHARLERVGGRWTVIDDGLSRNGTFVGDERVAGRRALDAGDKAHIDADKAVMLMMANPSMIKRPILEVGDTSIVGFKATTYEAALEGVAA